MCCLCSDENYNHEICDDCLLKIETNKEIREVFENGI